MSENITSVGRIVHYVSYGTPNGEFTSACRAAIITRVYRDNVVDLFVMNPEGLFLNHTVQYSDEHNGGTWHWPERV